MGAKLPDGGQVRVLNLPCAYDKSMMAGYYRPAVGSDMHGCWIFMDDKVHMRVKGADRDFVVPWSTFRPVIDGTDLYIPQPKVKSKSKEVGV